jgi:hypothetical protein
MMGDWNIILDPEKSCKSWGSCKTPFCKSRIQDSEFRIQNEQPQNQFQTTALRNSDY